MTLPDGSRVEKTGNRFRWFSTGGMRSGQKIFENGTGISSYIHVAGDPHSDTLHITEGPLKADIASYLSGGELFIGLTGVQNVRYLADVVAQLKPKRILECIGHGRAHQSTGTAGTEQDPLHLYAALRGLPGLYLAGGAERASMTFFYLKSSSKNISTGQHERILEDMPV